MIVGISPAEAFALARPMHELTDDQLRLRVDVAYRFREEAKREESAFYNIWQDTLGELQKRSQQAVKQ